MNKICREKFDDVPYLTAVTIGPVAYAVGVRRINHFRRDLIRVTNVFKGLEHKLDGGVKIIYSGFVMYGAMLLNMILPYAVKDIEGFKRCVNYYIRKLSREDEYFQTQVWLIQDWLEKYKDEQKPVTAEQPLQKPKKYRSLKVFIDTAYLLRRFKERFSFLSYSHLVDFLVRNYGDVDLTKIEFDERPKVKRKAYITVDEDTYKQLLPLKQRYGYTFDALLHKLLLAWVKEVKA